MGPSSSNVEDMESCKTLGNKNFFIRSVRKKENLRDPALGGLHSEEGDHGHGAVVVVEGLAVPHSHVDLRCCRVVQGEDEVLTPGRAKI